MSETTWAVVVVTVVNMVGSVLLTLIRLYFRAHYDVGEYARGNGYNVKPHDQREFKP